MTAFKKTRSTKRKISTIDNEDLTDLIEAFEAFINKPSVDNASEICSQIDEFTKLMADVDVDRKITLSAQITYTTKLYP